jgi:hypothetical protein
VTIGDRRWIEQGPFDAAADDALAVAARWRADDLQLREDVLAGSLPASVLENPVHAAQQVLDVGLDQVQAIEPVQPSRSLSAAGDANA